MASRDEVKEFLLRFRCIVGDPSRLFLLRKHPGSDNLACLLELGWTEAQAKAEVFRLTVENYSKGPESDRDREGQEVWVFCREIQSREVYIKLVVTQDGRAKLLSFHFAKHPMQKPFAGK
jgi:hypothetical protein